MICQLETERKIMLGLISGITTQLTNVARRPNTRTHIRRWVSSSSSSSFGINNDADVNYSFLHHLPWQFLRNSDSANFDKITCQRNDVPYDHLTGKPRIVLANFNNKKSSSLEKRVTIDTYMVHHNGECEILWSDGLWSHHNIGRLQQQYLSWNEKRPEDRILWENLTDKNVRSCRLIH
mmetsp:Transcript_6281/g.7003  ORF Transcript_6281/g.7003 Transcript_6281/m.7003 type:complete len:179 (+) Transcript_6281:34-570(+)